MKNPRLTVALVSLAAALAAVPASAGPLTVAYTDLGPASYTTDGYSYWSGNFSVTDSFTLSSPADLVRLTFPAWLSPGDTTTSVSWDISSDPFGAGTVYASGTQADPSNSKFGSVDGYDLDAQLVSLPNVNLSAGSYYLTLSNGTTAGGNNVFWDVSDGPSSAQQTGVDGTYPVPSETFVLYASTPEPSSFLLLGSGLAGLAGLVRRKIKA